MGFKSILKTIGKTTFPFITAAANLGGPIGVMAAAAVGNALGMDVPPTDIEAAIAAAQVKDPDTLMKLKQADQAFELQMKKLGIDSAEQLEQIAAADRANARDREIAMHDKIPAILAISVTAGFFTLVALMIFHAVPTESKEVVSVMAGTLGTAWIGVMTYYFGSSAGSAAKSNTIAGQLK